MCELRAAWCRRLFGLAGLAAAAIASADISAIESSEALHTLVATLTTRMDDGDDVAALELAGVFAASYRPDERLRALPIYTRLAEDGNVNAAERLATLSFFGAFGDSSLAPALTYGEVLTRNHTNAMKTLTDTGSRFKAAFDDAEVARAAYERLYPLCEQKGLYADADGTGRDYLAVHFLSQCLKRYSFGGDTAARLDALAAIEEKTCSAGADTSAGSGPCLAGGYRLLARGGFAAASDDDLRRAYVAASRLLNIHLRHLKPVRDPAVPEPSVSAFVYKRLIEVQGNIDSNRLDDALSGVTELIRTLEASGQYSAFELASAHSYRGFVNYRLGRIDAAIDGYRAEHRFYDGIDVSAWESRRALMSILAADDRLLPALREIVRFLDDSPSSAEILPAAVAAEIRELSANP